MDAQRNSRCSPGVGRGRLVSRRKLNPSERVVRKQEEKKKKNKKEKKVSVKLMDLNMYWQFF